MTQANPKPKEGLMHPGLYVVRMPHNGTGSRLHVMSRPFFDADDVPDGYARKYAESWRDFIQSQYPKDDVFVVERPPPASPTAEGGDAQPEGGGSR